jgi:hypothetical protein
VPVSDYTPTLAEVGSLISSRTYDSGGNEAGTFTPTTRPTNTQAQQVIEDAVAEVYPLFGQDIPDALGQEKDALRRNAKRAVAQCAAATIELTYWPEQVATGRSAYKMYLEKAKELIMTTSEAIRDILASDEPGVDDKTGTALFDGMPIDEGGVVGWMTRW